MSGQRWVIAAVLAIALANTGCVTCCHKTHEAAYKTGPECELPTPCRGQVYVFLIHGLTPTTGCGLEMLRTKLAENGFAKVGVGELGSGLCIEHEIKNIRACEPDARFVLVGYDLGGASAVALARHLSTKCVPIEAVVLLDPLNCGAPCGLRTLLITSGKTTSSVPYTDRVIVPDVGHHKLPAHPTTVAAITELLKEIATQNYQPVDASVPAWSYRHAPEMRPTMVAKGGPWDFLADRGDSPDPIGTRVTTTPIAAPVPVANSAGPVVIKP
jgi:hypothetical protein